MASKFDFNKVKAQKQVDSQDSSSFEPLNIFYSLEQSAITDPRPLQVEALDLWKDLDSAGVKDIVVPLDTGAGKTLIGLLIAESIRRKTKGKVIYVCPDNNLIAQVEEKAISYGIKNISVYAETKWKQHDQFLNNENICLTNYDAVFTDSSRFQDPSLEIKAYIFDDAHSSLDKVDAQYSVTISDMSTHKRIVDILNTFEESMIGFKEIYEKTDPSALVLVPPNIWEMVSEDIKTEIVSTDEIVKNKWTWPKIRNHFDKCLCLISPSKIEFSLLYPETKNHPVLSGDVKRIYLSATIPNTDDLKRIYDVIPTKVNLTKPDFRPQRLFLFPRLMKFTQDSPVSPSSLPELTDKALVLVPRKEEFDEYGKLPEALCVSFSSDISENVEKFKSMSKGYLVLASRYDGIDFPGDVCKFLVVDGLPYVGGLKNRFFSEKFDKQYNSQLRSLIASKLVQAFGRTVRSGTDYSAILVMGRDIEDWISNKDNRKYFKQELAQDLEIGRMLSSSLESLEDLKSLVDAMMSQDDSWKEFLEKNRNEIKTETVQRESLPEEIDLAGAEREIYDAFLSNDYGGCLMKIALHKEKIRSFSPMLCGLYISIEAVCHMKNGEVDKANNAIIEANKLNKYVGLPPVNNQGVVSLQATKMISINSAFPTVNWSSDNKNFEEDLYKLGEMLGFSARRPEKEGNGTLDVCWADDEQKIVVGFECKANKDNESLNAKEIGQSLIHLEWLKKEYKGYSSVQVIVGDIKQISNDSTPGDLRLLTLSQLDTLAKKVGRYFKYKLKFPKEYISNLLKKDQLNINGFASLPLINRLEKFK